MVWKRLVRDASSVGDSAACNLHCVAKLPDPRVLSRQVRNFDGVSPVHHSVLTRRKHEQSIVYPEAAVIV